jgi:mutual gliding-motility protein MglA
LATINLAAREIHAKIVYYGPGLSGKTTNLVDIHRRMPPELRGRLQSIATEQERTLFFDFVPIESGRVGGYAVHFHLYSVPGQEHYVRTRRAILGGADGVVFVADAAADRLTANLASVEELRANLTQHGRSAAVVPIVLQYNKMDLDDALSFEQLEARLNVGGWPSLGASAVHGNGVAETLRTISKRVAGTL